MISILVFFVGFFGGILFTIQTITCSAEGGTFKISQFDEEEEIYKIKVSIELTPKLLKKKYIILFRESSLKTSQK